MNKYLDELLKVKRSIWVPETVGYAIYAAVWSALYATWSADTAAVAAEWSNDSTEGSEESASVLEFQVINTLEVL